MNHQKRFKASLKLTFKDKKRIWKAKLEAVSRLTDGLGLGVDRGIKQTVATFHLFGISTTASHEGKIHRWPIPYVDVGSPHMWDLHAELKKLKRLPKKEREKKDKKIRLQILRENMLERKKIIPLIEEFYSKRQVPYEIRLNIDPFPLGWSRIQSRGCDFQRAETNRGIRMKRLRRFKAEMRAFTVFLKKKYFAD